MNIFSDRFRLLKIFAGLLLIAALLVFNYFQVQREVQKTADLFDHPTTHAGLAIALHYARVDGNTDSTTTIVHRGLWIDVVPRQNWQPGDKISLRGTLLPNGKIRITQYHRHWGANNKLLVSQVPMLIVFYLIWRRYRFDWKRFIFSKREQPHA